MENDNLTSFRDLTGERAPRVGERYTSFVDTIEILSAEKVHPRFLVAGCSDDFSNPSHCLDYWVKFRVLEIHSPEDAVPIGSVHTNLWSEMLPEHDETGMVNPNDLMGYIPITEEDDIETEEIDRSGYVLE